MHVLIVKMSSLGDVIHTLPALTDARAAYPDIQFDWVVEESFAEIPTWHPAVQQVIPINLRQWRKNWLSSLWHGAANGFKRQLRETYYDHVIDAQGLLKSAWVTWQTHSAKRSGLDRDSAREPLARFAYQQRLAVPKGQHAIDRVRQLFAQALGYSLPDTPPDYGLSTHSMTTLTSNRPSLVFLHGTTWDTKHWPESYWCELAEKAAETGFEVLLPWGNEVEKNRAERIAQVHQNVKRMPATSLHGLAAEISTTTAVVGVDTGLAHLAAALRVPCLSLYGATQPALTGTKGVFQVHVQSDFDCAPCLKRQCSYTQASAVKPACYTRLNAEDVWQQLLRLIADRYGKEA